MPARSQTACAIFAVENEVEKFKKCAARSQECAAQNPKTVLDMYMIHVL